MRDVFVDVLHDQGRTAEVNAAHAPNPNANVGCKNKKTAPRQGSPAPSNTSAGGSSCASSTGRTVRFQDHVEHQSGNQAYGSSARSRWQGSQPPRQGNNNDPGHGEIVGSQGRGPPVLSPRRRDLAGRLAKVGHDIRRYSLGTSGRQGNGEPALSSSDPGLYRQLEARLEVVVWRPW